MSVLTIQHCRAVLSNEIRQVIGGEKCTHIREKDAKLLLSACMIIQCRKIKPLKVVSNTLIMCWESNRSWHKYLGGPLWTFRILSSSRPRMNITVVWGINQQKKGLLITASLCVTLPFKSTRRKGGRKHSWCCGVMNSSLWWHFTWFESWLLRFQSSSLLMA